MISHFTIQSSVTLNVYHLCSKNANNDDNDKNNKDNKLNANNKLCMI